MWEAIGKIGYFWDGPEVLIGRCRWRWVASWAAHNWLADYPYSRATVRKVRIVPANATIPPMPDLRAVVRKAMKRRGWTAYRLIQELGGRVKPGTVYGFLRDDKPTDITSENLGHIFDALGIKLDLPPKD